MPRPLAAMSAAESVPSHDPVVTPPLDGPMPDVPGTTRRSRRFGPRARRWTITVALVLFVLFCGYRGFEALARLREPPTERQAVARVYNVETLRVEPVDVRRVVVGYGTARADREVVLSAEVSGRIVEVHPQLEVGNKFRAATEIQTSDGQSSPRPGDVLCRIDEEVYRRKFEQVDARLKADEAERALLAQQEANNLKHMEKAQTDFELSEDQFQRIESLRKKNVSSESDLTSARLDLQRYREALITLENERALFPVRLEQLERKLDTHRAEMELAKLDRERTTVRPPFSGVLAESLIEVGQHVKVGDPLVRLVDLSKVEVAVSVPLEEALWLGEPLLRGEHPVAALSENATAEPRWTGRLVRVAPKADEATRTIRVFVLVENATQPVPLLPGTFVYAHIAGPTLAAAMAIPREAVVDDAVLLARDGVARRVPVRLGPRIGSLAVASEGLAAGDEVILTNLDVLRDGAPVKVGRTHAARDEIERRTGTAAGKVLDRESPPPR